MNVLQILPSLDVGGVETGTLDLARYLVSHGHKAVVVSSGGRLVKELDAVNARHYNLPVGKKSIFTMVRMAGALRDIIRAEDIDIVHARSRIPALIAFMACRMTNTIFITTAHGYYKKHLLSAVMGWGRLVIVASNIMAKHMTVDFGVPINRIRLIPRGVDLTRFKYRERNCFVAPCSAPGGASLGATCVAPVGATLGMVSRITPLKGHADFIKAVSIVNRHIPDLKVLIAGDAPKERYREDLELLVRRLGLSRTIEFLGARADVPAVMDKLDMLVSATVTPEAFGRVIIEAQAMGVPVVATKVGGVVDIIEDGVNGLLAAPANPKDMADKILKLYRDKDLALRLSREARDRVEKLFNMNAMMERTIAVYEEARRSTNILIIKMSAIGDVILSVPSLRAVRTKYPAADIKVLVGLRSREVLDHCPYINDRIVCDFEGKDRGLRGLWRVAEELRKNCFDIVIDLQNNRRSHILSFLSGAPLRYGYDNRKFSFLLNRKIKDDAPFLDPIEHQFRTLKLAGVKPQDKYLELWPGAGDQKQVEKFLADNWVKPSQPLVGINVRASARWQTKNWPAPYIAELCDRFARELNMRVVLTGSKADADFVGSISRASKSKPIAAAGVFDMLELASLIKSFKVYLTPDSAPMHIAASVGTPFVVLFGPTDPRRHIPPSKSFTVIRRIMKCSPCYSPRCFKNTVCMRKITVDEVFESMKRLLGSDPA